VQDPVQRVARKALEAIYAQREEILTAFVAKYGCQPDEVVQLTRFSEEGQEWRVELIKKPMDETDPVDEPPCLEDFLDAVKQSADFDLRNMDFKNASIQPGRYNY
jgi:hypothetical protein